MATQWSNLLSFRIAKDDLVAAFSMALVAIPLSLGIAIASGVPPMAGIISVIIGGLIATFIRGSRLAINGPAASLIIVAISGIQLLGAGDASLGFRYFLAASVCAGVLLVILGLLKAGKYGDIFPSTVIYGILGAVGLMILGSQIHVAFGLQPLNGSTFDNIKAISTTFYQQNPLVSGLALIGVLILTFHGSIKNRFVQAIPAPIWLLFAALLWSQLFGFHEFSSVFIGGYEFPVGPQYLVEVPTDVTAHIFFPSFDKINSLNFWMVTVMITLIVSVETIISIRVTDKLDPLKRQTNVSRDLIAVGICTALSSSIGGLPVITAIPMYVGAKTRWASLYQGIIITIFILLTPFLINGVPMAALSSLLLFTGYKLVSPKIFKDTYRLGLEQFVVLSVTILTILVSSLLMGVLVGISVTLLIHYGKSNLTKRHFLRYLLRPSITVRKSKKKETECYIETSGVINFVNILQLKNTLRSVAGYQHVILDMSNARLVDNSVLEYLHEYAEKYDIPGVQFDIIGLDAHETSSRHPYSMHVLPENKKPQLTKRQLALEALTQKMGGNYWHEVRWDVSQFKSFNLFQLRNIEFKLNTAKGMYKGFFEWESCDIAFEESGLFAGQERHTSVILLHLPFNAPAFVVDNDNAISKMGMSIAPNFIEFGDISTQCSVRGVDSIEVHKFMKEDLVQYFEQNDSFHIECNGTMILIFKEMRFANPKDMEQMHDFAQGLAERLLSIWREQAFDLSSIL